MISVAYSQVIRRFPYGGGYVVATEFLGKRWGVVSGSALLIDYALTVSVSVAGGADQMFSVLPPGWAGYKLAVEAATIGLLILLNLRGVKESVTILAPIFGLFLVTHAILIVGGFLTHAGAVPQVAADVQQGFQGGLATLGAAGLFGVFLRAYSMGAGTYTGIEALPATDPAEAPVLDPAAPTAVLFVGGFSGLGVHALLTIIRTFPGHYRNFRPLSVAVLGAATSRGIDDVDALREWTAKSLRRYAEAAHRLGFAADSRMSLGADAPDEALAAATRRELRRPVFFLGKLIFEHERWHQKLLHSETAYALQRRLQFEGLNTMVLPVRVIEATAPATRPPSEPAGEGLAEDVAHPSPA